MKKILLILFISLGLIGSVNSAWNDDHELAYSAFEDGDYQKAFEGFSTLAKTGDIDAQEWLAYMYSEGLGVSQDYNQVFNWHLKAANQGSQYSQDSLGLLYYYGNGVAQE